MGETFEIARVGGRRVLNSHCRWTLEFGVELADGRGGRGASPRGETPSIYERAADGSATPAVVDEVRALVAGRSFDQETLDGLLLERGEAWGRAATYAVSVAFFEATCGASDRTGDPRADLPRPPRILFNLLNGGLHAYTNPVASDFTEFLVVPHELDLAASIDAYLRLLELAPARLSRLPVRSIGGNPVADLGPQPNEAACGLVRELLDEAGFTGTFGIMIDASAGDWARAGEYVLPVTGARMRTDALVGYWLALADRHGLELLEDPLGELDLDGWQALHEARPAGTAILGDNFTSSDPDMLPARAGALDGVLLKPDQAGTVTRARRFGELAHDRGLQLIASHRSIETDGVFLVHLATLLGTDAIKIGPFSDLTSVIRTNELLRSAAP